MADELDFVFMRGDLELRVGREPLVCAYDAEQGLFQALPEGETTVGKTDEDGYFIYYGAFRYCMATPAGPIVGFQIIDFLTFEPEEFPDPLFGPRFDVPELGLRREFAGSIVYAAQAEARRRAAKDS